MVDNQPREGPQEPPSAISRLPPEILGDIFLQNVLQLPAQRGRYYRLFDFLFVCWRWYNVARCSPHLWCHLGNNINYWPIFVALSKGTDLFVHMYDICSEYRTTPDDHLTAMFRNHDFYSRIRGFTLDGQVDVLSHIFPEDTPRPSRLASLSITRWVVRGATGTRRSIPDLLVESSSETLRRLSISACIFDTSQLPIVGQLTHLSLTDFHSPDNQDHSAVKQLLLVLQANPGLEELQLDRKSGLRGENDESLPVVSLTRLRKLRMTLHVQDFVPLLQQLRIVSEVEEIELKVEDYERCRLPILEKVPSWFNDVVSPHVVQCIETRPACGMFRPGIKYVRKSDNSRYPNMPHHSSFVELRFESTPELSAYLRLETLQGATRLELLHDRLLVFRYREIFERAPMVRELVIWAGRECGSVRALLPATQAPQDDTQGGTYLSYVPLRNLSYLRIIEADLREVKGGDNSPNGAVILDVVRQRRHLGLGLQRLELVYCRYVSPDWVGELQQFVPDVFWDGEDGVGGACSDDSDEDYCPSSCDQSDSESSDSGGDTASSESTSWMLRFIREGYLV